MKTAASLWTFCFRLHAFRTLSAIFTSAYSLIGEIVIFTKSIVFAKSKFSLLNSTFCPHRQDEVESGLLNTHREGRLKKTMYAINRTF